MSRYHALARVAFVRVAILAAAVTLGACSNDPLSSLSPVRSTQVPEVPEVSPYDLDFFCESTRRDLNQYCWTASPTPRGGRDPEWIDGSLTCACTDSTYF